MTAGSSLALFRAQQRARDARGEIPACEIDRTAAVRDELRRRAVLFDEQRRREAAIARAKLRLETIMRAWLVTGPHDRRSR